MTYVNVTTANAEIAITNESGEIVAITTPSSPQVLTAYTEGPQGPSSAALGTLGDLTDVDTSAVTDGSVLVYDGGIAKFTADSTWTTTSLTDGGNF